MSTWTKRDGEWVELTEEEVLEQHREAQRQWEARVAELGHDCYDHSVHGYDPSSPLGDYYVCGICGDLLQVG